jgi:uncharacterized protein
MSVTVPACFSLRDTQTARGRGLFAARSIAPDEIIEESPVVLITTPFDALPPEIQTIAFYWSALTGEGDLHALALGMGSLFNHANPANVRFAADPQAGVMRFTAARPIAADEELTINYNAAYGGISSEDDDWFARLRIARL